MQEGFFLLFFLRATVARKFFFLELYFHEEKFVLYFFKLFLNGISQAKLEVVLLNLIYYFDIYLNTFFLKFGPYISYYFGLFDS